MKKLILISMMFMLMATMVLADCDTIVKPGQTCSEASSTEEKGLFSIRDRFTRTRTEIETHTETQQEQGRIETHTETQVKTETETEDESEDEIETEHETEMEQEREQEQEHVEERERIEFNRTNVRERDGELVRVRYEDGREEDMVDVNSTVPGLENAIIRVRKNETRDHLQSVLSKIEEKRLERLAHLEDVLVQEDEDNEVAVYGKGPAKLLGTFKWEYSYKYKVNETNGELTRERNWYDFAFTEIEE